LPIYGEVQLCGLILHDWLPASAVIAFPLFAVVFVVLGLLKLAGVDGQKPLSPRGLAIGISCVAALIGGVLGVALFVHRGGHPLWWYTVGGNSWGPSSDRGTLIGPASLGISLLVSGLLLVLFVVWKAKRREE
jgi:hypothetical protein